MVIAEVGVTSWAWALGVSWSWPGLLGRSSALQVCTQGWHCFCQSSWCNRGAMDQRKWLAEQVWVESSSWELTCTCWICGACWHQVSSGLVSQCSWTWVALSVKWGSIYPSQTFGDYIKTGKAVLFLWRLDCPFYYWLWDVWNHLAHRLACTVAGESFSWIHPGVLDSSLGNLYSSFPGCQRASLSIKSGRQFRESGAGLPLEHSFDQSNFI